MAESAQIVFFEEILDAVERFLAEHQEEAPLQSDLERALAVAYLLGVMREEVDALWDGLASLGVFGGQNPRSLFEEFLAREAEVPQTLKEEAQERLLERKWFDIERPADA